MGNITKCILLSLILCDLCIPIPACAQNSKSILEASVSQDQERLVAIYKDIHQNPELGFMEVRTAGIIAKELKALGYDVKEKIGITGVVGVLKNGAGPVVMYRADMDCNAVKETTGLPYASTRIVKKEDGTETPVMQYQAIVSRGIDPKNAAVITVGSIQAGSDNNVIPASALLKVNLRWFNEVDRKLMVEGIKRINEGIAHAYNMPEDQYPEMKMKGWSLPLDNDVELTQTVQNAIADLIGEERVLKEDRLPSVMGSEDFHHLVIHNEAKKYCYIQVGIAETQLIEQAVKEGKMFPFGAHNGDFRVDLSAIPEGTKIGATGLLAIFNAN